ncbi:MAG TPA: hypothetical protein VNM90_24745 [Haliangium sp.]|nr:hypothetical protein [Haliangium sp.]
MKWLNWLLALFTTALTSLSITELHAGTIDSRQYVPTVSPNQVVDVWSKQASGAALSFSTSDPQLGYYDALKIDTTASYDHYSVFSRSIIASASDTITVTAKVRLDYYVGSPGAGGCAIWVENNQDAESIIITPAGLRLYHKGILYAMDTMSNYREYKIVAVGNTLRVYVDGGAAPVISTTFGGQSSAARSWVAFGDGSGVASARSSWAHVRYTVESP